jgi:cytochrome P450
LLGLWLWLCRRSPVVPCTRRSTRSPRRSSAIRTRDNSRRTLAFGRGIHYCIGSALGRLEASLALEELTRRFPDLRLGPPDQEVPFHPDISFRGPQVLWVQA